MIMLYFSSILKTSQKYKPAADNLFAALNENQIKYDFIYNTKDIWVRDFMPVRNRLGQYISFRYEPSYLKDDSDLRTDFKTDIAPRFDLPVTYSEINLDGGNAVFSPSRERAIISDRLLSENPEFSENELICRLEALLSAEIILIPSLKEDFTGHADGMVRFVDENTVIGNRSPYKNGLEQRIKTTLNRKGISVIDFPYYSSPGISAEGSYINYLETENDILLPVFGSNSDKEATEAAKRIFTKKIIPVRLNEIAEDGGALNCISWETKTEHKG